MFKKKEQPKERQFYHIKVSNNLSRKTLQQYIESLGKEFPNKDFIITDNTVEVIRLN